MSILEKVDEWKPWKRRSSAAEPNPIEYIDDSIGRRFSGISEANNDEPSPSPNLRSKKRKSNASRGKERYNRHSVQRQPSDSNKSGILSLSHSATGTLNSEWFHHFRFNNPLGGFDLEVWWRRSLFSVRLNVVISAAFLAIAIAHICAAVVFITAHFTTELHNPYMCNTDECHKASAWMVEGVNKNVEPCHNFYQFMCSNITEKEGQAYGFEGPVASPAIKIEFGEDSILSKVLKDDGGHSDEMIKYYQNCLDLRKRKTFGLDAFKDTIHYVLNVSDIRSFENSPTTLEHVGANVFRVLGHGVFLNMAFFTYPYIQHLMPSEWLQMTNYPYWDEYVPEYQMGLLVETAFDRILSLLGVPPGSHPLIEEMVEGLPTMMKLEATIFNNSYSIQLPKSEEPPAQFKEDVRKILKGLCPPMGLKISIRDMMIDVLGEPDYKVDFVNPTALKYITALQLCFEEDPTEFTGKKFANPRTAFVAVWILGIFNDYLPQMDIDLVASWSPNANTSMGTLFSSTFQETEFDIEVRCFVSLWKNLGYLPQLHYLHTTVDNPVEFLQKKEAEMQRLFAKVRQAWLTMPLTEMWEPIWFIVKVLFERGLIVNVLMPLNGGEWDPYVDDLGFTEDHLRNSFTAVKYTVEKARRNWMGSTNPTPIMKWWGDGDPGVVRGLLFNPQVPVYDSARFLEEVNSARNDRWELFQNRKPHNYLLYPMAIFTQPHTTEVLALQHGAVTYKIIAGFVSLLIDAVYYDKYVAVTFDQIFGTQQDYDIPAKGHECKALDYPQHTFEQELVPTNNPPFFSNYSEDFSTIYYKEFMLTVSIKLALKEFLDERKDLLRVPFGWNLTPEQREMRMHRRLPGELEKYTEKQLFFMALVRQGCRGSWTKHDDPKGRRYAYELVHLQILTQTKEFAQAWNCPKRSFMNLDTDICLNWDP